MFSLWNLTPCCHVSLPYIVDFDIKVNHQRIQSTHLHTRITLSLLSFLPFLQCWTLCHSIMSHATLILFHHVSMLTLRISLMSRALWFLQVSYYGILECIWCFVNLKSLLLLCVPFIWVNCPTNVDLVLSFYDIIWVSITRVFTIFDTSRYGFLMVSLFSILFISIYHARTFVPR